MRLLAAGFAGSLIGYPLAAAARVDMDVDVAPPPAVVENPPDREGYIYAPGYWDWDNAHHRHVWKHRECVRERRGEHWVSHAWVEHEGRCHLNEGTGRLATTVRNRSTVSDLIFG